MDAAYNLARWLMRNDDDAADAVQEACLRALRFLNGFRGGDSRPWLLAIVRNTCFSRLRNNRVHATESEFDDDLHSPEPEAINPEILVARRRDEAALKHAIEGLPEEFREVIVLRELEGLSYKQIAEVAEIPVGTVMSRLARARGLVRRALDARGIKGS